MLANESMTTQVNKETKNIQGIRTVLNPPSKKRYVDWGCQKEHFFKNFRKSSKYYSNLMKSQQIGHF